MRAEKNRGGQGWQRGSGQREVDKWRGQSKRTGMAKGGRAKEDRHAEGGSPKGQVWQRGAVQKDRYGKGGQGKRTGMAKGGRHAEGGSPEGQAGQGKRVVWRSERGERPGRLGRASGEGLAGKTGGTDRRPVPGKCRQAGGVIPGREGAERERQDRRGEAGKLGEAGQTGKRQANWERQDRRGKGRTDGERQANWERQDRRGKAGQTGKGRQTPRTSRTLIRTGARMVLAGCRYPHAPVAQLDAGASWARTNIARRTWQARGLWDSVRTLHIRNVNY